MNALNLKEFEVKWLETHGNKLKFRSWWRKLVQLIIHIIAIIRVHMYCTLSLLQLHCSQNNQIFHFKNQACDRMQRNMSGFQNQSFRLTDYFRDSVGKAHE